MSEHLKVYPVANSPLEHFRTKESAECIIADTAKSVLMQQRNAQAVRMGLPPLGTRLVTECGMEWSVLSHIHAPNLVSYARNRGLSSPAHPHDLLPRMVPEKLSKRLLDFWVETDKCSSKGFLIVDTLPHLRPQYAYPLGHTVDAWSVPDATLFAFDFATLHETIIAHEIAHVWIDLVEGCEDYRYPVDWLDTARAQQILFIQSFVLDGKVNEVIAERGFDLSIIAEHQRQTISNLTRAVLLGHRPPSVREAVTSALLIASTLLEQEQGQHEKETTSPVLCYDGSLESALRLLRQEVPEIYELAERFVAAVQRHGYANREQIRRAVDECLTVAFEFSGDRLDLENDLCEVAPNETYQLDKSPDMLPSWPVRAKIEIAKIRAKLRVGNEAPFRLSQSFSGAMQIEFLHPCGVWTSPVMVPHAPYLPQLPAPQDALPPHLRHLPEAVRVQLMPPQPGHRAKQFSAGQIPQVPMPQVPQITSPTMAVFPELPDVPNSWLNATLQPPFGRHYMPGLGVWLSQARLQEQLDKREHPYSYVENNPLVNSDPSGRITFGGAYGNCCGPLRRCNNSSSAIDCIDRACRTHDMCLGTWQQVLNPFTVYRCDMALARTAILCLRWGCSTAAPPLSNPGQCRSAAIQIHVWAVGIGTTGMGGTSACRIPAPSTYNPNANPNPFFWWR